MSTLNYENVGALVEYDYLQGTILALYSEDDTADVESESEGSEWTLLKVPIFYHCEKDSVARSNGALEGAAAGFAVGDLVVVLKAIGQAASSLYSLDKIELKGSRSTATGPKYYVIGHYDGVQKCFTTKFFLYAVRRISSLYYVEKYSVEKLGQTNTAVLDGVVTFSGGAIHYDQAFELVCGNTDTNSICVRVHDNWFRNSTNGIVEPVDAILFPKGLHTVIKVPIKEHIEGEYPPFRMINPWDVGLPINSHLSPGGSIFGQYMYNTYKQYFFSAKMMQLIGADLVVVPSGNETWLSCKSSCVATNKLLIAISVTASTGYPVEYLGYFIGEWSLPQLGSKTWGPFLTSMTRTFVSLSQQEMNSLHQIVYIDARVYLFFNFDQGTFVEGVKIKVYDLISSDFITEKLYPDGWHFSRVSALVDGNKKYLCFCTVDTWDAGDSSDVYLVDPVSLETLFSVDMPLSYFDDNFIAVFEPVIDNMTIAHNTIRRAASVALDSDLPSYLGRSSVCDLVAKEHADWNIENARDQHEDANGDTVEVRASLKGISTAGENMLILPTTGSLTGDINYAVNAITGWPASPNHYANMIKEDYCQMGWATGMYAEDVSNIIVGPGAYINGAYTTVETNYAVSAELRGKIRLFVVVFAGG